MQKDRTGQPWGYWLAGSIWVSCFFKRFPAICAGYIDLSGCPYDGAAAGADIPVKFVIRILDFVDTAPAVCAALTVRGYSDGRTGKLSMVEILIE